MTGSHRLTIILLIVATASLSSLVTLVLAPVSETQAQIVTSRVQDSPAAAQAAPAAEAGKYAISAYAFAEPKARRSEDPNWTVGFFALNQESGKVANCIYMWSGTPMNKCIDYSWIKLPK